MPKVVDRDAQRRAIGAALLTVVAEHGLEEVSVRTVAARAGRSPGAVQKYFRSKEEMLLLALDIAGEKAEQRLRAVDRSGTPRQVLHRLVVATLPLDPERRAEAIVWAAFAAMAVRHPPFAEVLREIDRAVSADLVRWLEAGRADGTVALRGDPRRTADAVVALSDGIAARLIYHPEAADELLAALDTALDALLSPPKPPQPGDTAQTT
ncbi:transcriptional regulator [Actinoplanes sp. SE50]|uniref:TetR/AcrR family transcriptional regulator n=1 Tax=unclassified Actinoplanes TaxID=2626549 RepID=UPI00023EBF0C|nr:MULTISPECIES: TetR/AcrR family transcriptional regulator [unclassified Actinoplanes]AEV84543.1 HTH-type transcriptional regulator betI [Actinoplanes sp. SE50/110]ATO82935.1 transcriptional regulator [Actinoplanes sp. SE50]SLM00343.1 TetR family transcriptional regulator [Actinoplanes sp. SE50/110]